MKIRIIRPTYLIRTAIFSRKSNLFPMQSPISRSATGQNARKNKAEASRRKVCPQPEDIHLQTEDTDSSETSALLPMTKLIYISAHLPIIA